MSKEFVNQNNARPGKYGDVIKAISSHGVCPFCPEKLKEYHKNPVDVREHWIITDNMYPYKPTNEHILLIHREHITHITEMSPEAWVELLGIIKEKAVGVPISGGSVLFRFGDTKFTGASVTHLHCHLVQSNPDDPEYRKETGLLVRIG